VAEVELAPVIAAAAEVELAPTLAAAAEVEHQVGELIRSSSRSASWRW
jgi:hypothetical protein